MAQDVLASGVATEVASDRIEKTVLLRAPQSRVWRAIASAKEFGAWFGVDLAGEFAPGSTICGQITIPGYEHVSLEMRIERIDPESCMAYSWHPFAIAAGIDYSAEPMTLVEFNLSEEAGATRLTIVESGFDRLPPARRAEAFRMNDGGWTAQIKSIEEYVRGS